MDNKVVAFGEIMLRLSTQEHKKVIQSDVFDATYGGGEANVAVSLARFGLPSYFVTILPNNELGLACESYLKKYGVKTDYIKKKEGRIGIYFVETGAAQRPSKVIYDRKESVISKIRPEDIEWEEVFKDTKLFHFSGITPSLSDTSVNVLLEALKVAKSMGVMVSCDFNYREKLWTREKANRTMNILMEYVDIGIGSRNDVESMFGKLGTGASDEEDNLFEIMKNLKEKFNLQKMAVVSSESHSSCENSISAILYGGEDFIESTKHNVHAVDAIGVGDAFSAGLIYGFLKDMDDKEALEFAVCSSCLKHTIPGDFNLVSVKDVRSLMKGKGLNKFQR